MATKATKSAPPARTRLSKAEVQHEFEQIRKETEAARESQHPKTIEADERRSAELRAAVENVSVDSVTQQTFALNSQISRTLIDPTDKLTNQVDLLANVQQAVELERRELERLHKIDIAATSIDQLIQDYQRERERLTRQSARRIQTAGAGYSPLKP